MAEDIAAEVDEEIRRLTDDLLMGVTAPFAAQLTEQQKLAYYRTQLFSPDGTPNLQGRAQEMTRLGPENFALVFRAVIKQNPSLAISPPPAGAPIPAPLGGSMVMAPDGLPSRT